MAQSSPSSKVRRFPKPAAPAVEVDPPAGEAPVNAPEAANDQVPAPVKPRRNRRFIIMGAALAVLAAGGWYGYDWWTNGRFMVATDDAYVGGDIATISPKLAGYVAKVNVVANQSVKAGDALVTLDDGDYRIARDSAQAQIDTATLTVKRIDAQIASAQAALAQAKANTLSLAATQRVAALSQQRAASLASSAVASQADLDKANAGLDQANAAVTAGDAQVAAAQSNIAVLEGQRAEAQSQLKTLGLALDKANRDLGFTVIRAPYDGVVGNLAVQDGDLVSAGAHLASLVPVGALYVDANFKETQLSKLVAGETVTVKLDAADGQAVQGTIVSLAPASGSVFSLLPAENATGNFTKVVQRVPVRIALPAEALESGVFRAGLSVTVDVDTRTAPGMSK